jgi:hypothetical protein
VKVQIFQSVQNFSIELDDEQKEILNIQSN